MSTWLQLVVAAIYVVVAVDLALRREWMGLVFAGYAVANIGLVLSISNK